MTLSATSPELEDLVLRAKSGETAACDELARDHRQAAYVFALQLVGNADDAMDLAQEAMLRFFSTLDRFQTDRAVRPWLFTIVRNLARDFWRRGKLRRHQSLDENVPDLSRALADPAANPEQNTLAEERRRRLWRVLSQLAVEKREILVLRDFHDLSYAEIARILRIPIGTVMSRLHAARKNLRREFLALETPATSRRDS
jgi:RNA polymerase sigma-70 factor (ECF subfamily)